MSGQWGRHLSASGPREEALLSALLSLGLPSRAHLVPSSSLKKPGHLALCPPPLLVAHSPRFLGKLLSRVRSSPHISDLCDVVHAHAVGPFSVYVDYVRNQQYQEETYSRLM